MSSLLLPQRDPEAGIMCRLRSMENESVPVNSTLDMILPTCERLISGASWTRLLLRFIMIASGIRPNLAVRLNGRGRDGLEAIVGLRFPCFPAGFLRDCRCG